MGVAVLRLVVMGDTPTKVPARDRRRQHSLPATAKGTATAALLIPLLTLAILHPVAAIAGLGLALAIQPLVRGFCRLYRARKRRGQTRRVCAPEMDVCIEV
jgi:hypothetical protein